MPFARAIIDGLHSQQELNGKEVELLGGEVDGRFPVKVVKTGQKIKVRGSNLLQAPAVDKDLPKEWEHAKNLKYIQDHSRDVYSRQRCLKGIMGFLTGHVEGAQELVEEGVVAALLSMARDGAKAYKAKRDDQMQRLADQAAVALSALASRSNERVGRFDDRSFYSILREVELLPALRELVGAEGPIGMRSAAADAMRSIVSQGGPQQIIPGATDDDDDGESAKEAEEAINEVVDALPLLLTLAFDGAASIDLSDGLKAMHSASGVLGALIFLTLNKEARPPAEKILKAAVAMLKRAVRMDGSTMTNPHDFKGWVELLQRACGILHLYSTIDEQHKELVALSGGVDMLKRVVEAKSGGENITQFASAVIEMHASGSEPI
mmetsp:Transcript_79961/g.158962  ORF Transcript_79961/g.158962 Transcript_79961/m.158962 type:complete len:379 (-) Transcript_79961:336-1472(-)